VVALVECLCVFKVIVSFRLLIVGEVGLLYRRVQASCTKTYLVLLSQGNTGNGIGHYHNLISYFCCDLNDTIMQYTALCHNNLTCTVLHVLEP